MNNSNANSNSPVSSFNNPKRSRWLGFIPILLVGVIIGLSITKGISFSYENPFAPSQQIRPWSQEQITYYNDTSYDKSLQVAIKQWEHTGIPVDFVEINSIEDADLLIVESEDELQKECPEESTGCIGLATIGFTPNHQSRITLSPASYRDNEIADFLYVPVIAHELGHVLGLDHNSYACSLMAHNLSDCRVRAEPLADSRGTVYFCGPIEYDIRNVRKLYGLPENNIYETDGYCLDETATTEYFQAEAKSHIVNRATRTG